MKSVLLLFQDIVNFKVLYTFMVTRCYDYCLRSKTNLKLQFFLHCYCTNTRASFS